MYRVGQIEQRRRDFIVLLNNALDNFDVFWRVHNSSLSDAVNHKN